MRSALLTSLLAIVAISGMAGPVSGADASGAAGAAGGGSASGASGASGASAASAPSGSPDRTSLHLTATYDVRRLADVGERRHPGHHGDPRGEYLGRAHRASRAERAAGRHRQHAPGHGAGRRCHRPWGPHPPPDHHRAPWSHPSGRWRHRHRGALPGHLQRQHVRLLLPVLASQQHPQRLPLDPLDQPRGAGAGRALARRPVRDAQQPQRPGDALERRAAALRHQRPRDLAQRQLAHLPGAGRARLQLHRRPRLPQAGGHRASTARRPSPSTRARSTRTSSSTGRASRSPPTRPSWASTRGRR